MRSRLVLYGSGYGQTARFGEIIIIIIISDMPANSKFSAVHMLSINPKFYIFNKILFINLLTYSME
jgi:hypothetical protein